jgi:hypothetical protein
MLNWLKSLFAKLFASAAVEAAPPVANPTPDTNPTPVVEAPAPGEAERPNPSEVKAQKLLRIPFAQQMKAEMKTRGKYRKGYPEGAIVHFTAGRWGTGDLQTGINNGYCYLLIDEKGNVYQSFPLDRWGYHAGVSSWKTLGSGVSQYIVGIEIACAGGVTPFKDKFKTWFGTLLGADQVRHSDKHDNIQKGYYHKYTEAQEEALVHLLLWLKQNNPDVFDFDKVLGHDEVAPTRKNDPGASLSCSMPEFRQKLKDLYKK